MQLLLAALALAASPAPQQAGERLDVLFIGDRGHHQPAERLNDVFGPLLRAGFAVDWEEDLDTVTPKRLADYECVVMYANQAEHRVVPKPFFQALQTFVREGGGFVALHCTSGCFMESQEWLEFVGARFVSHGAEVFKQEVVAPEHPLMAGWENFSAWDETYVQAHHPGNRVVLTMRDEEPWSWVRTEGEGRIFYTASGHDQRVWREPAFLDLLVRAIDWTAGPEATLRRAALVGPQFQHHAEPWVPNYEAHDPHPEMQKASTPEQARDALIVPAGFRAELFACEPMVVNPVAMTWDERGRCWVLESPDYPNDVDESHAGRDQVSILEDTDGDGRADKKTVFRAGLNLPTSILKVRGGVIIAQAPDLLFLGDDDGDDRCDRERVLLSGFGRWDTHAGPSSLRWGPDNAIWGSVGYAAFDDGADNRFGSGLWRWDWKTDELEFIAQFTNNTWGMGFRADGELFGSTANGAPSFFVGAPKPRLKRSAPEAPGAAPVANTATFHPALANLHQGDYFGRYTAAAGHAFATGPQMPDGWADRSAFVCGPTGHLVGRMQTYEDGSGWRTRDAFNLCSSTDEWFCPVQAEVGPDGAIWVADFAQFIILHNLPGNPERGLPSVDYGDGNAHLNPLRDREHGRIFRIVREDAPRSTRDLTEASDAQLLDALVDPNQFWQSTALRMLVEGGRHSAVEKLLEIRSSAAVSALRGLGELQTRSGQEYLEEALTSTDPAWCKAAMRALPSTPSGANLLIEADLLNHESADLRRVALLTASRMPESAGLGVALAGRALMEDPEDPWLRQALSAAVSAHASPFLAAAVPLLQVEEQAGDVNLLANPGFEQASTEHSDQPANWRVRVYGGEAEHSWETGAGRGGSRALVIRSTAGADTSWCTDVDVEPSTRYRLSGWIRTSEVTHEGDTHGALFNIHPRHVVTEYVQDDSDWTKVSLEFETGPQERHVSINCLYGGWGHSTGEAVYDDMELISLGAVNDLRGLVELARKFGEGGVEAAIDSNNAALLADGDAEAGRNTFFNNAVVACSRCHAWGGEGGGVGPDLAGVGQRLTREKLLESILDPNAEMAESWTAPASAMPALRPFLSDEELRDLVTFLSNSKD